MRMVTGAGQLGEPTRGAHGEREGMEVPATQGKPMEGGGVGVWRRNIQNAPPLVLWGDNHMSPVDVCVGSLPSGSAPERWDDKGPAVLPIGDAVVLCKSIRTLPTFQPPRSRTRIVIIIKQWPGVVVRAVVGG